MGSAQIAANSVGVSHIPDNAVNTAQLANNSITLFENRYVGEPPQANRPPIFTTSNLGGLAPNISIRACNILPFQRQDAYAFSCTAARISLPFNGTGAFNAARVLEDNAVGSDDLSYSSIGFQDYLFSQFAAEIGRSSSVGDSHFADNLFADGNLIPDNGIQPRHLGFFIVPNESDVGVILTDLLMTNGLEGASFADNAVTRAKFAADIVINSDKLADNGIAASAIANEAISTAKLANGAVSGADFADGAITRAKLAANFVLNFAKFADNAVTSADFVDGAVVRAKLAEGAVASADFADGAVTTAKIVDRNVTGAKFADGAVTGAKLAANAVTHAKLVNNVITSAKFADGAVTHDKLVDRAVTTAKLADSAVS